MRTLHTIGPIMSRIERFHSKCTPIYLLYIVSYRGFEGGGVYQTQEGSGSEEVGEAKDIVRGVSEILGGDYKWHVPLQ